MRNRSLWLLAGLALVASLVDRPRRNRRYRARVGRNGRLHPRPGAAEPPGPVGRQQPVCDEPRPEQHLVRLPDPQRHGRLGAAAVHRPSRRSSRRSPLTIRFTYKPDAEWSDGKAVTAADFRATWKVFTNPANNVISRTGWEDITSVGGATARPSPSPSRSSYADWESLVSSGPYPAHIIAGKNMNDMFLNSIPVSSGPWMFDSWNKGQSITVKKNPRFKASIAPG